MNLNYNDIVNRQRNLTNIDNNVRVNVNQLYDSLKENYSYHKAKTILENWNGFGEEDVALRKVMEIFTIVSDNDNDSNIINAANIIEGKIIPKLRNAKQTNALNHYKTGWIKHKHTSMLNDTKDNENAVAKARANGGYLGNSLHPHRKYKRDIYGRKMKDEVKKNNQESEEKEQDTTEECFDKFIQIAYVNEQCDRVLSNHQKLTKRFALDNIVRKCPLTNIGLQECVMNICSLIDTYDIPFGVKYNIALENTMYLIKKNCVPVENSFIVETVTDYFLMSEDTDDDNIHDMGYIIKNSKFFTNEELDCVSYLYNNEDAILEAMENEDEFGSIEENKIHDAFLKYKTKRVNTIEKKKKVESFKIKKEIHSWKKSHNKTVESFKAAISRIFVNSPEGIIHELPDIFVFVRLGAIIGAMAINPFLGVITMITNFFLKMKISRERMEIVVAQYEKERDNYKKKMNEATDEKKKEKYEKLYKQYKSDLSKLEAYRDELYTDEENDKRMEEKYAKEAEAELANGGSDFNFDDFDMDFNFEEQTSIKYTEALGVLYEQLAYTSLNVNKTISSNIQKLSSDDIYNITEAVKLCNDMIDCKRYINILEDELVRLRSSNSTIADINKINCIKECINDINTVKYNSLFTQSISLNEDTIPDMESIYSKIKCKSDILNDIIEYSSRYNTLTESTNDKKGISFLSKVKIAAENLRRFGLKAKDKDKQLSMKVDSELNRTMTSAKKAMISDNRKAIIKGTFLPSASKCIHIALASGAAYLFDPALAVIGLIGYIGTSRKINKDERKLILDDIDIEIKMCDKYMKIAEDKDDLVAVREIMKTKRDLERQRSRILYNNNYVFKGKKQYDMKPASMNNDDD